MIAVVGTKIRCSDGLRQNFDFPSRFNLIWVVQSSRKKYFPWSRPQITGKFRASRSIGGAYRDRHGRWVRDAVDAAALLTNGAGADGEVVWS
jgi:hypothetical protein